MRFYDGQRPIATVSKSTTGLYAAGWILGKRVPHGKHVLRAVVSAGQRQVSAARTVRVCGR